MEKFTQRISGTYFKGNLNLDKPIYSAKPLKITVTFDELPIEDKINLSLADFNFLETQEFLKTYNGSFSEEVVEERRADI